MRRPDDAASAGMADSVKQRVLCFPAYDRADEITAAMLAQILEHKGFATLSFPLGPSLVECLASIGASPGDVVCNLSPAALCGCASAGHVQTNSGCTPEAQGGGLRLGLQRRYQESHGPLRANATRSPLHEHRRGSRTRSGTCLSVTSARASGGVTKVNLSSLRINPLPAK